uniref:Ion transport domain-containing protein n=1 Tax=Denticeps clupeoides TaxID=299321 RepID=A0AAY4AAH6_9TELE
MALSLSRGAPRDINHWWSKLRCRLQNRKGWNEMFDETFFQQTQKIDETPLFLATKENNVGCIEKLLSCSSSNVFERGVLGETALHIAALNDNLEVAIALMDKVPELINEPMNSEFYQGLTALHIAVMNQNVNLVRELIKRGADVATPRVTGSHFQKWKGALLYYGEHILAFACCVGNEEIVSMVIKGGANIRAQDTFGNTVLHLLILQPMKNIACQMLDLLLSHDEEMEPSLPLDKVPNYRGLTPLKLAAKEGNIVIFQHLVNRRRVVQWNFGPLSSKIYDLTEIDSWSDDLSVLEIIASSQKKESRRILEVTPVQQLINLKWNLYGKYYFTVLLMIYLVYIGIFTLCCLFRPLKDVPVNYTDSPADKTIKIEKTLEESYVTYDDHLRLVGEIISVVGAILILLLEIPDILWVGPKRYFGQSALAGPFHVILIVFATLVIILCALRVSGCRGESDVMAICLVMGWCNCLYFTRGFQSLGPYMIMIQKIIFEDLYKFLWLSFIMIIAFSTGLWVVYMTQEVDSLPSFRSFRVTLFSELELSIGKIDLPVDQSLKTPPIVCVLHICFSVVTCVLLFNLLTATMADTQFRVSQEKDELWRVQVVATTLMLERRLPRRLWPRLGICGFLYVQDAKIVEERNDASVHKLRRYAEVFTKKLEEEPEKTDASDSACGDPRAKAVKRVAPMGLREQRGWQIIRMSTLGLGIEDNCERQEKENI